MQKLLFSAVVSLAAGTALASRKMPLPYMAAELNAVYGPAAALGGGFVYYINVSNISDVTQTGKININGGVARLIRSHTNPPDFTANITVTLSTAGFPDRTTTISNQYMHPFSQSWSVPAGLQAGITLAAVYSFAPVNNDYSGAFLFGPQGEVIVNEDRGAVIVSMVGSLAGSAMPGVASPSNLPLVNMTQTLMMNGGRPF